MWSGYLLSFLAGAFAANSVPHLISGLSGRPFRTPFVRMTGGRKSGPVVNVIWGWANAVAAYALFALAAEPASIIAFGLGALAMGIALAIIFSRDHD